MYATYYLLTIIICLLITIICILRTCFFFILGKVTRYVTHIVYIIMKFVIAIYNVFTTYYMNLSYNSIT